MAATAPLLLDKGRTEEYEQLQRVMRPSPYLVLGNTRQPVEFVPMLRVEIRTGNILLDTRDEKFWRI